MKPAPFQYHRAETVSEAVQLLSELEEEDPKLLSGGQSLVPMMNFRLATPGHIVDINGIEDLARVEKADSELVIGALVRHADIEDSAFLQETMPLLPRVAGEIGYRQIRYRGTLGGSIGHADPAAEWPLIMRVLDADLTVSGPAGSRRINANDFFTFFFTTVLEPDELITAVHIPIPDPGGGWGFSEFARKAGDFAIVAAAAMVESKQGKVQRARIALGGTGPTPERAAQAEELLVGAALDDTSVWTNAAEAAAEGCDPTDDAHASGWYRRELVKVQVERVLKEACEMAAGTA